MEAFESEGRPSAISDEALQSSPVGSLDADAGIEAEPAPVIPAEHVLSVVGFQEALAAKVSQDSGTDRVLETLQQFAGEGGGFVETEEGFWMRRILSRVTLNLLEQPVHDAQVVVVVGIKA
jgi:hypothetical protein